MDMPTITMERSEAQRAFIDYRRAVRERHNAEDEMIMRGYKALAKGHQVINLLDVMKAAGEDAQCRPKLAVARASLTRVYMARSAGGALVIGEEGKDWGRKGSGNRISFPRATMPAYQNCGFNGPDNRWPITERRAKAMVPNIPPALRPQHALSNYHMLWEAEWSNLPPKDPALLKHCGGWLYVVLAVWDLTPLEQAVLGLTRN